MAEERTLAEVESELQAARAAAAELDALKAAKDLVGARSRLAGARSILEQLPAATARLSGNETARVAELEKRIEELRGKLRELAQRERVAREEHSAARLETEIPQAAIAEHRARLEVLRDRERELRDASSRHNSAITRLDGVRRKLGADADLRRILAATEPDLEQIERLVRDAQLLARERDELRSRLEELGSPQEVRLDGDALAVGVRALSGWLRAPLPPGRAQLWWRILAVALSAALAVVIGASLHPFGFTLLLVTASMIWVLIRQPAKSDSRAGFVDQYAGTRLEPPIAWEVGAVETRLEELQRERGRIRAAEEDGIRRQGIEQKLRGLEARERDVAQRRDTIRSTLGVTAPTADLAIADLASAFVELHKANADMLAAEARAITLSEECEGLREVLSAYAAQCGEKSGADSIAFGSALDAIEQRNQALREASAELQRIDRVRAERAEELREQETYLTALFEQLDLRVGDNVGLAKLLEVRGIRQEADARVLQAEGEARALEAKLDGAESLAGLEAAELEARLVKAQEHAERQNELVGRIAAIQRGVRDARMRSDLEDALAAEEAARSRLEAACDDAMHAEAGRLLLEEVEHEHDRLSRPAVLSRASELFAAFTSHRHALDVAEIAGESVVRATDATRPGLGLEPEQLSSGTRAQLLIAIRLAFAGQAERGSRLPLFVDDALATSDPDRVRAIAGSLFTIAREEGRQVIVLTKDEGDLTLVRSEAAGEPLRVVDLAAVRRMQGAESRRERLELPAPQRVPAPEGRDGPAYAQVLGVPTLDPWHPLDEAHLYHVLPDDMGLLHQLLTWGIERVGPLCAMLTSGVTLSLDARGRQELDNWMHLATRIYAGWRTGRGTPLTRDALGECPAISSTFRDRVVRLAEELGWNAKALVEALLQRRIERFHESKAHETRDWLEERGHISREEPLTRDEAWGRVLREFEGHEPAQRLAVETLRRRFDYLWDQFERGAEPSQPAA